MTNANNSASTGSSYYIIEPCNTANGVEIKLNGKQIILERAQRAVDSIGESAAYGPVVLLGKANGMSLSIYASGRIMIKDEGSTKKLRKAVVERLAHSLMAALEKEGAIK